MMDDGMLVTLISPCLISHSQLNSPHGPKANEPACSCKYEDSDWPELTLHPHSCLKKHSIRLKCIQLSSFDVSDSRLLFMPPSSLFSHMHIYICMCFFCPCVSVLSDSCCLREGTCLIAFSLHNACPISWLLGLLIGGESRGPIGVPSWTLWLEGMVCDAKRQWNTPAQRDTARTVIKRQALLLIILTQPTGCKGKYE